MPPLFVKKCQKELSQCLATTSHHDEQVSQLSGVDTLKFLYDLEITIFL